MVLSTLVDLKLRNFAQKGSHVFISCADQVQHYSPSVSVLHTLSSFFYWQRVNDWFSCKSCVETTTSQFQQTQLGLDLGIPNIFHDDDHRVICHRLCHGHFLSKVYETCFYHENDSTATAPGILVLKTTVFGTTMYTKSQYLKHFALLVTDHNISL